MANPRWQLGMLMKVEESGLPQGYHGWLFRTLSHFTRACAPGEHQTFLFNTHMETPRLGIRIIDSQGGKGPTKSSAQFFYFTDEANQAQRKQGNIQKQSKGLNPAYSFIQQTYIECIVFNTVLGTRITLVSNMDMGPDPTLPCSTSDCL